MPRRLSVLVCCLFVATLSMAASDGRRPRMVSLDPGSALPMDLVEPEDKSSWDLSSVSLANPSPSNVEPALDDAFPRPVQWVNVAKGEVTLPWGTLEVTLQRGLAGYDRTLIHRFFDPRLGVVAQISGPATIDGLARTSVDAASILSAGVDDAASLKLYVDEVNTPNAGSPGAMLNLGWDRGPAVNVASLLGNNQGVTLMSHVIALDYWDFAPNTSGTNVAQVSVTLAAGESCNTGRCGYDLGDKLGRQDRGNGRRNNQITELQDRTPTDFTIWLRAGAQSEGVNLAFGNGETGFCWQGADSTARPRKEVPLWRFSQQDGDGWFFDAPEAWTSATFACEQTLWNQVCQAAKSCGVCFLEPYLFRVKPCVDGVEGTFSGTQGADVLKGGVVKLPSGHRVNALLVRQVAEFCVYSGGGGIFSDDTGCVNVLDRVRTLVYLWQSPHIGTTVLLQTNPLQAAPEDKVSFSQLHETNINYGLFPPESIAVRQVGANSVQLWWDVGNVTSHVKDYKIYWDTDSGAATPYANSTVVAGPPATVAGLDPATTYYFTVVTRSDYTNPSTAVVTTMESLLFPKQVHGDPGFVYPVEVHATTTGGACAVSAQVEHLLLGKTVGQPLTAASAADGGVQFFWDPATDPCIDAYEVTWAGASPLPGGFGSIAQTIGNAWTGDPPFGFFLIHGRGTGGIGP